ncbi:uncharacterized protein EV420DRAFT_1748707 [Desarmillaria tabescens]|uniref:Uncharacterized protein n=1 Tax=Armillaria tabescens TaxID=1929756 RepID=A0AA39KD28_ARMTA|nr:uncharacterized protein EV420DRAFT_1748707 [Desarmillaria tabescens]KAK0457584.1 hypothetical protein EV420DRAFT_1748707 [Desarmillaria tabescens]
MPSVLPRPEFLPHPSTLSSLDANPAALRKNNINQSQNIRGAGQFTRTGISEGQDNIQKTRRQCRESCQYKGRDSYFNIKLSEIPIKDDPKIRKQMGDRKTTITAKAVIRERAPAVTVDGNHARNVNNKHVAIEWNLVEINSKYQSSHFVSTKWVPLISSSAINSLREITLPIPGVSLRGYSDMMVKYGDLGTRWKRWHQNNVEYISRGSSG